jgi:hypothetical protein
LREKSAHDRMRRKQLRRESLPKRAIQVILTEKEQEE